MKKYAIYFAAILLMLSCGRNKYEYDASGIFETTEIIVSSEASGIIEWFDITEGDRLEAGTQVGLIDTTLLHLQKLQLSANIEAVSSRRLDAGRQIAATREQIATQIRERERTQRLIEANAANTKQLDDINSNIAVLEKQLAAQQETVESGNRSITGETSGVEAQILQTEERICKSSITTPITGTILVKYAEKGEVTIEGMPLFKIADTENMILRAYITNAQLTRIQAGQQVSVFTDYGESGSREYTGTVTWISDLAEFTPKTIQTKDERVNLVYAVKIAVKNDGFIKIGMYGDIKLQ